MKQFQQIMGYHPAMAQSGRPASKPRSEIGERIAQARIKLGLSQRALAEKLGITQQSVTALERRESIPRSDTLLKLCDVLGVTANDLLGMDSQGKKPASRGRLHQTFETLGQLPRRKQAKILDVVEALLAQEEAQAS
jgi:transcriptional regulator with XRE-family HTH domain